MDGSKPVIQSMFSEKERIFSETVKDPYDLNNNEILHLESSIHAKSGNYVQNDVKKTAFTLSEVLITLGIIGIVAAMTMPALIGNQQKKETAIRLKKFYSTIQQVVSLSVYENGDMQDWDFPKQNYDKNINIFFEKYYLPYMKKMVSCYSSNCFAGDDYSFTQLNGNAFDGTVLVNYFVKLTDGSYIYFLPNVPNGYIWMYVDLNGHQKPNRLGRDIFVFQIFPRNEYDKKNIIRFWGQESPTETLTKNVPYGCNKEASKYAGFFCGELILRNNWEIPKDYPW